MKRILLSLITLAVVIGGATAATVAYFSDTETSTANTFAAGTIDISVNDQNPWSETVFTYSTSADDLKPGMSKTATLTVANVGQNDLVLWKRVKITARGDGYNTEPEHAADPTDLVYDLDSQISYDMTVGSVNTIPASWDVRLSDVADLWIPLGNLAADDSVDITQVYKLLETTGNEYQGDTITFDIDLYAEQKDGPGPEHTTRGVVLENKDTAFNPIMDSTWGLLTFDMATGDYRLRAWNLPGAQYQLQAWDYATDSHIAYFGPVSSGANLDYTGNYGFSANVADKYWLRETASWNNADTLWESNLVN